MKNVTVNLAASPVLAKLCEELLKTVGTANCFLLKQFTVQSWTVIEELKAAGHDGQTPYICFGRCSYQVGEQGEIHADYFVPATEGTVGVFPNDRARWETFSRNLTAAELSEVKRLYSEAGGVDMGLAMYTYPANTPVYLPC